MCWSTCNRPINQEKKLDRIMKDLITSIDTISITKCTTMKYYKIMKNTDCTSYILITYMEDLMSHHPGMCVMSIHSKEGSHVRDECYIGLDGETHLGILYNLPKQCDRKKLKTSIIDFIN